MEETSTPRLKIVEADLNVAEHQAAVVALVDEFLRHCKGQGLSADVREALVPGLKAHPTTLILLAYSGDGTPVGIAVCFKGYSTFAARPLLNIHDLVVLPEYRGCGVGRSLLEAVEAKARAMGCCKLTLEVGADNSKARQMYKAAGFSDHGGGQSFFLSKMLPPQ